MQLPCSLQACGEPVNGDDDDDARRRFGGLMDEVTAAGEPAMASRSRPRQASSTGAPAACLSSRLQSPERGAASSPCQHQRSVSIRCTQRGLAREERKTASTNLPRAGGLSDHIDVREPVRRVPDGRRPDGAARYAGTYS